MSKIRAEYIWIDGYAPTQNLRSKTKVLGGPINDVSELPDWGFDGSSTLQADGNDSDCLLKPVNFIPDPFRRGDNILVLCEVFNADGSVHVSNYRAKLRGLEEKHQNQECWFGIEQEYTFMETDEKPYGWPDNGFPEPQGKYYCGVGCEQVYGRDIVEAHLDACLWSGIELSGINAEVMPAQWEYQVGPLGPLDVSDQLWLARWILRRISEDWGVMVSIEPKPMVGDWNGAGAHTNFSTKSMRESGGLKDIEAACEMLGKKHKEHIAVYGSGNEQRLTGLHETCSIDEFRYGNSDRGASVRIPMQTCKDGCGYLEDRRPSANMDPYRVCTALMETICDSVMVEV
jgi:glutamine synthetase